MRREVGEDLHELITVDEGAIGIHENAPSGEGDSDGKKRKKKGDKGKEEERGRPKSREEKGKEDQDFLMKCVPLETSRTSLKK